MSCSPCIISRGPEPRAMHGLSRSLFAVMRAGLIGFTLASLAACEEPPSLPPLGADITQTSVSGLSSGSYMAGQFQFAYSKLVIGAGLVAGGPYGCAESVFGGMIQVWPVALAQNLNRAINGCMGTAMAAFGVPDLGRLARRARERAEDGSIDPLEGLRDDRIYLFTGLKDRAVAPLLVRKAVELYEALGVTRENIAFIENNDAGHGFLTEDRGNACGITGAPFLNDCDYDQAGAILKHIYGPLKPPKQESRGELFLFGQTEFAKGSGTSFDDFGAAFIPESCVKEKGCLMHVAFHGCGQGRAAAGDAFIKGAGYNRWAAENRIIVLYPQVTASSVNPKGCWDWWGYTGPKFLTRSAPQTKAVRAMLARLAE